MSQPLKIERATDHDRVIVAETKRLIKDSRALLQRPFFEGLPSELKRRLPPLGGMRRATTFG